MAAALKKLTSKPVRYVVNTHWHDDHHNGNQVYRELWPSVEFIAHSATREDMYEGTYNVRDQDVANFRTGAERYRRCATTGKDDDGKPLDPRRQARAKELAGLFTAMAPEIASVRTTPPDLTFEDHLTIQRGDRTIEIRWLGRGNTRGDIVVYLPKERIVATGDLLVWPIPFAYGSYYEDWAGTMGRLDSLQADVIFPGHGLVQRDRTYLRQVQGLLQALVEQVKAQVTAGATLEETKARVTLPEWKQRFAGDDPRLQESFQTHFMTPAVERAWRQAKGEPDALKGV
jgi:glyoxylase-like metal-dependent hydrolase (beta-lactamase superfamily II)